jgi:tryptophan-rich hypothetical protein
MQPSIKRVTNPKKLLHSKWTAVTPTHREKHFLVTKLMVPELANLPIEYIELEAIHSKRTQLLPWQQLNDAAIWHQGWV